MSAPQRGFGVLAGAALGLAGCTSETTPAPAAPTGPRDLVIAAQANVHGDIEPCG